MNVSKFEFRLFSCDVTVRKFNENILDVKLNECVVYLIGFEFEIKNF